MKFTGTDLRAVVAGVVRYRDEKGIAVKPEFGGPKHVVEDDLNQRAACTAIREELRPLAARLNQIGMNLRSEIQQITNDARNEEEEHRQPLMTLAGRMTDLRSNVIAAAQAADNLRGTGPGHSNFRDLLSTLPRRDQVESVRRVAFGIRDLSHTANNTYRMLWQLASQFDSINSEARRIERRLEAAQCARPRSVGSIRPVEPFSSSPSSSLR